MVKEFFINLSYACNERCVFCAADIALEKHKRGLTLKEIADWLQGEPPDADDHVMIAGGEPTVHPKFLEIVAFLAAKRCKVTLFTNGLRLANPRFARSAVQAGVKIFEIALFGATAERHDAVTQVRGSFFRTLECIGRLSDLKKTADFQIVLRLLVSRQTAFENPAIVRMANRLLPDIDELSLNRLIFSESAKTADAAIPWQEARAPINETIRLSRKFGRHVVADVPLCVLDDDNLVYLLREPGGSPENAARRLAGGLEFHYFDVNVADKRLSGDSTAVRRALPDVCLHCDFRDVCGRVEGWYIQRYGTQELTARLLRETPLAGLACNDDPYLRNS